MVAYQSGGWKKVGVFDVFQFRCKELCLEALAAAPLQLA